MSEHAQAPSAPPPLPDTPDPVKVGFAVQWVPHLISKGMGEFTDLILNGNATQVFADAWNQLAELNLPEALRIRPEGLEVGCFTEASRLLVTIKFPPANLSDEPIFGIVLTGPCQDPEWGLEARRNLSHRYFVLFRGVDGTYIEEWTSEPPVYQGAGPKPELPLFVEWVLRHAGTEEAPVTHTEVAPQPPASEPIVDMDDAIKRARKTLPDVVRRFVNEELEKFSVKVAIKDGDQAEHFWLADTKFNDGYLCGTIDADPKTVSTVQRGDEIKASGEHIVDWMYLRDGKMHGNYTLRAQLPTMSESDAAEYRDTLAELEE